MTMSHGSDNSRDLSYTPSFTASAAVNNTAPVGRADSDSASAISRRFTLRMMLSRSETMDLFMLHLKREFQEELLLSLIEFTQFRELIELNVAEEDKQNGRKATADAYGFEMLKLCEDCPYSAILSKPMPDDVLGTFENAKGSRKVLELKYKAHLMFLKYVKSGGATFEINISSQLRRKLDRRFGDLTKLMEDENYSDVTHFNGVWSQCLERQWSYTVTALARFRGTEEFKRIADHFSPPAVAS